MPATLSAIVLVKAGGVLAVIAALARRGRGRHPFARLGPANQVTALRALLVALLAGLVGESPSAALASTAIAIAVVVTVLDGVDGWLARRTGMTSPFGARFDMEIDALLVQVLALLAWQHGKAGAWVVASGLLRYVFVAAGEIWPWMRRPLTPTFRGKAICVVQIAGLLVALLPAVTPPASALVAALALIALACSFAVDTLWLWQHRLDDTRTWTPTAVRLHGER